jgi:protein-tyrosine phosphatase
MAGGFVDIHSHFVYGVDDGSPSPEVSRAMLELAASSGTSDIVATPHANSEFQFDAALVAERLNELRATAPAGLRLHAGCDFHLSFQNVESALEDARPYTINRQQYLLVELPDFTIYPNIRGIFESLIEADIIPIITHPERNTIVQERLPELKKWVELGCLVQITAQSILGKFGSKAQKFCDKLLASGQVHFVASDAHDCVHRPPRLDLAYEYIRKHYNANLADLLFIENPSRVLYGDDFGDSQKAVKQPWYKRFLGTR